MTIQQPPPTKGLREWLTRNKVFFETVSASALALAAIIVSVIQLVGLDRQNALIDFQTRVAEAQALPVFDMNIEQKFDPATNTEQDTLTISNSGGPVHEFFVHPLFQVILEGHLDASPYRKVQLAIQISDYYSGLIETGASRGMLWQTSGFHNGTLYKQFEDTLMHGKKPSVFSYYGISHYTIVTVSYTDILNRGHLEYYEVTPVPGGKRLTAEKGEFYLKIAKDGTGMKLEQLNPDVAMQKFADLAARCGADPCPEK